MNTDPITGGTFAEGWIGDGLALFLLLLAAYLFARIRREVMRLQPGIHKGLLICRRAIASDRRLSRWKENHPGAVAFIRGRLSRSHYLELHLIVGFAVVALFSRFLAELTEAVLENSPLVMVDRWVFQALGLVRTPLMTGIMEWVTFLGGGEVIAAGALLICCALAWRKRFAELAGLLAAVLGGGSALAYHENGGQSAEAPDGFGAVAFRRQLSQRTCPDVRPFLRFLRLFADSFRESD